MKKTRKNTKSYRQRNKRKTYKRSRSYGGGGGAAGANAPSSEQSVNDTQEQINSLFSALKAEQNKIIEADKNINNIRKSDSAAAQTTNKQIKDIKAENKKIKDAYYKIEEILNKINILKDKEKTDRGKKVLDMYVMKFFNEHGKKTPTVYFDSYSPKIDEYEKFGIDTEEFWVNPALQVNAIDDILDMKKSRTKYKPEMYYYKVESK